MKHLKALGSVIAVSVLGLLQAREVRTPLEAYYIPHHYADLYETSCLVDVWGAGYWRSANKAFGPCHGSDEGSLAQLIFGAETFTLAEAFPDASAGTLLATNPFVTTAEITPVFDYEERGAMFGLTVGTRIGCDKAWRVGVRAKIPFRDIRVEQTCPGSLIGAGGSLDDLFAERQEVPEGQTDSLTAYAVRLDFLAALQRIAINSSGNPDEMVEFTTPISIAEVDATGGLSSADSVAGGNPYDFGFPPVAVIGSNDGSLPRSVRWANYTNTIAALVGGTGSGVGNLSRARFVNDANYAALQANSAAQRRLFVVPTVRGIDGTLSFGANTIKSAIENAISEIEGSAADFLAENGVDFCDGHTQGAGDLDAELFFARDFCNGAFWAETSFGIRLPTGKKLLNCRKVLQQPLGNNGHVELRWGGVYGWNACSRVKFKIDTSYSWVLEHDEAVSAPFQGALIKNLLPPCVCAKISWQYFLAHVDMTLFANESCGIDIGYTAYTKTHDHICLSQDTATDLAGQADMPLDPKVLSRNTNAFAQKVRAELFMNVYCGELFAGFSHTFSGKNVMKDTDAYLGFVIHF